MKIIGRIAISLFTIAATFAYAQTNLFPQVQHVVVVIQENRTPDNLFQQDQTLINNGAHIVSKGSCGDSFGFFNLQPTLLATCWDTAHLHSAWTKMWANGAMTGGCQVKSYNAGCLPTPACTDTNYGYCPAMTYVQNTMWGSQSTDYILEPYFEIANQYGWANYMFQTSQGPSFPAHQFLFSGTSQPIAYNDPQLPCGNGTYPCYQWFDGENTNQVTNGCIADSTVQALDIDPTSSESYSYTPPYPVNSLGFPCYEHPSLATLLDTANITWKYYARAPSDLWNAPTAINPICQTTGYGDKGGVCNGTDWINNVGAVLPNSKNYPSDAAPFLTDVTNCKLSQVSWVIPDGDWSDHNGYEPGDGGPSWVAAIVNAIGQSSCKDGSVPYWQDTVILVTWDDWGGLYDDVVPPDCATNPCTGYNGGGGNGKQYVYGFRVPLLVVSAYAKPSYISGPQSNPQCIGNTYCHDFGSILNFIEYAFGTGGTSLGTIGDSHWPYADAFVLDTAAPPNNYSLYDFFKFSQIQTPTFTTIKGAKYPPSCFHTPTATGCFPSYPVDPDNDVNED